MDDFLSTKDTTVYRQQLLEEFDRLCDYRNMKEWNQLVRICEALRILSWGERQPLEAYADKWLNGAYYTELKDVHGVTDQQTVHRWSSHKHYFVLDVEAPDKRDYGMNKLAYQRNKVPKSPIRLQLVVSNCQQSVKPFVEKLDQLQQHLNHELRPQRYGEGFSYIGVSLIFSNHDDPNASVRTEFYHREEDVPEDLECSYFIRPRLNIGRLSTSKGEVRFLAKRHFTKHFGYLSFEEQKEELWQDFLELFEALDKRLKKKKLHYDVTRLEEDCKAIFNDWH